MTSRAPRSRDVLTLEPIERQLLMTSDGVPEEATHWSIQLMAGTRGITAWQVRQIRRSAGLEPHRIPTFKISKDPAFTDKTIDIVGLHMNPPDSVLILSVNQNTQIQALHRTQTGPLLDPGTSGVATDASKRNGAVALHAVYAILTGTAVGNSAPGPTAASFGPP